MMQSQNVNNAAPVNPMDVLHWPGILQIAEADLEVLQKELLQLLEKALQDLIDARLREGDELKQLFMQRVENMKLELTKVRQRMPEIYKEQRARLMARLMRRKLY